MIAFGCKPHCGTGGPQETLTDVGPDPLQLTVVGGHRGSADQKKIYKD